MVEEPIPKLQSNVHKNVHKKRSPEPDHKALVIAL